MLEFSDPRNPSDRLASLRKAREASYPSAGGNDPTADAYAQESESYLRKLQEGGWSLEGVDLEEIERRIVGMRTLYEPLVFGSAPYQLVSEAFQAIKRERSRRDEERQRAATERHERIADIRKAAQDLQGVDMLVDGIDATKPITPTMMPDRITAAAASDMADKQLSQLVAENQRQMVRAESNATKLTEEADTLTRHRIKQLAGILKDLAADEQNRAQIHRDNADVLRTEQQERERRAAEEAAAAEMLPLTTQDVQQLMSRVAELEAKLSAK